jgi:hypothetical protein
MNDIGESTRRELTYARGAGKPVRWWQDPDMTPQTGAWADDPAWARGGPSL